MQDRNTAQARRWFEEVWNEKRADLIDELISAESFCLSPSGRLCGPEDFKQRVYQPFLDAFPDVVIRVEGTMAEGDQVLVRWSATATHQGNGLGFPATGRSVAFRGMTWIRFREDGTMAEGWDCWDQTGLIQSLREQTEAPAAAS
jgi:steroid delta-isomerase-like uncharacterized protein